MSGCNAPASKSHVQGLTPFPPSLPPSLPPSSPQAEAALLRTLSPTDVASFYHTFLRPGGSARRLLTSQIFPQMGQRKGGTEGGKEVEDKVEEVVEDELALRATLPKY